MTLEIMFLGGSNTRMKSGYVPVLCDKLEATTGTQLAVQNLSVGISSSLMGIERFLIDATRSRPDVIFIEYAINDVTIAITHDIGFWRKSYEGLLRIVTRHHPAAKIYGLFFVARFPSHRVVADKMRPDMMLWAARYPNFEFIDVDAGLAEAFDTADRYHDDMHYAPQCFETIAAIVCDRVKTSAPSAMQTLPEPVYPQSFETATAMELARQPNVVATRFARSILSFQTVILRSGETLTLEVPGEIASISFVSTPQSGILEITDRHGSIFIPTLHRDVARNGNPLFMNAPRLWHDWTSEPDPSPQQVRLSVHDHKSQPYHSFFSMIEPTVPDTTVQLHCLLATHGGST